MSAKIRMKGVSLDSEIQTPATGRASLFYNDTDRVYKAKLDDGSVILLSVSQELVEDIVANLFQDSSTINVVYNDAGNIVTLDVIQSALNISLIPNVPSGNLTSTNVQSALNELQTDIDSIVVNTQEIAQDAIASAITAGTQDGITVTYNDPGNSLSFTNIDKGSTAVSTHVGQADPHTQYLKESDNLLINPQIINVKISNAGTGQFTDLNAALASITDSTPSKHYLIQMGAGDFIVNNPVNIPNYVSIIGSTINVTRIIVQNPTEHLLVCGQGTEISFLNLLGHASSIGSGKAAIHVEDGGDFVQVHKLSIYDFDIGVDNLATVDDSIVYLEYVDINGDYLHATRNVSENGFFAKLQHENFYTYPSTNTDPSRATILSTGTNSDCVIRSALLEGDLTNQIGFRVFNGGRTSMSSISFNSFNKAILNDNIGNGSDIDALAISMLNNTTDLEINHPSTTGQILGGVDKDKVTIDASSTLSVLFLNNGAAGVTFNGEIFYSQNALSDITEISDLIVNTPTMGLIYGGELTSGSGLNLNVATGFGYLMTGVEPNHAIKKINWNGLSTLLVANSDVYIYINNLSVIVTNSLIPSTTGNILLGRVVTDATSILYIEQTPLFAHHYSNQIDKLFRSALGPIFVSGSLASESGTRNINVTQGEYYFSEKKFNPAGGTAVTFDAYYKSATPGVYTRVPSQTTISNTQYDDSSGTLASIPVLRYAKHLMLIIGGPSEKYAVVYATETYVTQAEAENAPLPLVPSFMRDAFSRICSFIVRQGTSAIVSILDERPRIGFSSSASSGAVTAHGALSGLSNDDHTQYLLVNGSRSMSSDLNLGGNSITNVNLVDGVDISSHASRHLPNGADPLTTGVPSTVGNTNSEGIANAFSRQDHVHSHGNLGGGATHAAVTTSVNGYMSAADKTKLDGITSGATAYDNEQAQDAVGTILVDSASIDLTYNDATPSITASVIPSGVDHNSLQNYVANRHIDHSAVIISAGAGLTGGGDITASRSIAMPNVGTPGTYGSATQIPVLTTDTQGRVTSAVNTTIAISSAQVSDFNEAAQDAVGTILTDSATVDFTYNDAGNSITAVVLPAGVNHNALANYVANEHVNHSTVAINPGTGLSGGGDITTSRTLNIANTTVTPASYGTATQIPTIAVNAQGQLTAASNTTIAIPSTQVTDFNEATQDAIGNILTDTSTIDFTYNDVSNTISAIVIDSSITDAKIATGINATKIGVGSVDNTEFGFLDGVTSSIQTQLNNKQPLDSTLTALASFNSNGIIAQTALDTFTARAITGTASNISVTNGDGVAGNPTLDLVNAGTAGTYGSASQVPILTTDTKGRVTNVTNTSITIAGTAVSNTPSGNIVATNVQTAINELDSDKANLVGNNSFTGGTQTLTPTASTDNALVATQGRVLIGSSTAQDITGASAFPPLQILGTNATQIVVAQYSADINPSVVNLLKSRGGLNAQGLVADGDDIGRLQFRASDGGNFQAAASIRAAVDGTPAAGSMPGRLQFYTTPTGSTAPVEHARITQSGNFLVGATTSLSSAKLQVDSTTQGFLMPRMTSAQRIAIATPAKGLVVFDTDLNTVCEYSGTTWKFEYRQNSTAIQTSTSIIYANITEFISVSLDAGLYVLELKGIMQSTAVGTGVGLRLTNGTSTISTIAIDWTFGQAAAGTAKNFEYNQTATGDNITSASVVTANANFSVFGNGVVRLTAPGTVIIQIRTEVNTSGVSIRPDSTFMLKKIG